jgi:hypothetical protein
MKLCINCKYFLSDNYCKHPYNGTNVVDGNPKVMFASSNRSTNCGEQGKWFELRILPVKEPSIWQRIVNSFSQVKP